MNRTKLLTVAVIGLLLINLATLAVIFFKGPSDRHPPDEMRGPRGEGPKRIIIERLNFDEAQQKQYQVIIEEHRSKMQELNKASRDLHDDLYALLKENAVDTVKANSMIIEISANQRSLDKLNFEHFQKIKAICKGNQIERFNDLAEDLSHLFGPHGPPPGRRPN